MHAKPTNSLPASSGKKEGFLRKWTAASAFISPFGDVRRAIFHANIAIRLSVHFNLKLLCGRFRPKARWLPETQRERGSPLSFVRNQEIGANKRPLMKGSGKVLSLRVPRIGQSCGICARTLSGVMGNSITLAPQAL